jgi:AraC family transcriptional regulator, L-rhamnose operon regulatory protein RhaS
MQLTIQDYFPSAKHKLSIYRSDPEDNNKEHSHEFEEFVIVTGGRGFHVIDGQPYFIKRGDVFFIKKESSHFYDEIDALKLINILINPNEDFHHICDFSMLLDQLQMEKETHPYWLSDTYLNKTLSMVDEMFEVELTNEFDIGLIQESLFYRLVVFVMTSQTNVTSDTYFKIHNILKDIESNCYETVDWDLVAHTYELSSRTLYRYIKSVTGMTPDGFLRRLRLISARNLLMISDESITYIAFKCGFSSSSHFSTCYRSIFGKTPSEERG